MSSKNEKKLSLSFPETPLGLCTDCEHTPGCILRTPGTRILNCQEYDQALTETTYPETLAGTAVPANLVGLCNSCDHVHDCALRTPGSIIFHCQHYQ